MLVALAWGPVVAIAGQGREQGVEGFDPAGTSFGVELHTRWGQRVLGDFPEFDGKIVLLDARRRQVRVRLAAGAVRIGDSQRYTQMARGQNFFDAAHYPVIDFVSDPIDADKVRNGGFLRGRLTIRDVTRYETFRIEPAGCDRPGIDCAVVAGGQINRYDYGLNGWRLVLDDQVRFTMRVRLRDDAAP